MQQQHVRPQGLVYSRCMQSRLSQSWFGTNNIIIPTRMWPFYKVESSLANAGSNMTCATAVQHAANKRPPHLYKSEPELEKQL